MGFPSILTKKVGRIGKSEKRKEKSRDAARHRRSQELKFLTDMANLLPLPNSLTSQLDKASIMRLTVAFLKVQSLLNNSVQELFSLLNEDKGSMADACWPQALEGMLLALSSKGDIIYLTENVTQQLGLPQVDFIGKSIYDFCHPCDHGELRQVLSIRPDDELARSFFLRLKSTSASTAKGKSNYNNNQKATTYKVMSFSGRIVLATASNFRFNFSLEKFFNEEDEPFTKKDLELSVKSPTSHFLVVVGDPIPRPFSMKMSVDSYTFLTNHTLDMKYTYVDERIRKFLGYGPEDLTGRSVYQFHHVQDNESILKSYKTMYTKGQTETPPYRFLAKQGGYAWLQTQATLVSVRNHNFKSQAVVCIHTCLSEIEERDQILFISQTESSGYTQNNTQQIRPLYNITKDGQ